MSTKEIVKERKQKVKVREIKCDFCDVIMQDRSSVFYTRKIMKCNLCGRDACKIHRRFIKSEECDCDCPSDFDEVLCIECFEMGEKDRKRMIILERAIDMLDQRWRKRAEENANNKKEK